MCVCVCVWYPLSMHACLLRVAVTIGGVNLADSPFEIHVKAGKTSACTSHAEGRGWHCGNGSASLWATASQRRFTIDACTRRATAQNQPTDESVVTRTACSRDGYSIQLRLTYLG